MSKTLFSLAAAALIIGGLASVPTSAEAATKAPMAHKASHKVSCYDYAWDSQQQKDCLAKGDAKPAVKKASVKKKAKKAAPKTTS
jgi:hypothetical protein